MSDAILHTPRLALRPLEVADAAALWPFVSDPEVARYVSWDAHRDPAETNAWLAQVVAARAAGVALVWAIVDGGAAVGAIGLHGIARQFRAWRVDRAELGYWLAPTHHGKGLMTEAAREVIRHGFTALALHKITVGCVTDNAASRRVIEKLGFRFVGERRDHLHRHDRWWNHLDYEMTIDEWRP